MGRLNPQEAVLQHFSHVHPLQPCNVQPQDQIQCNGCNLPCTGSAFRCTPCNYILHKSCTQIPRQINHPSHPHPLTLLATPPSADGSFSCNACGQHGTAFSFRCAACDFDIHAPCATFPRTINHHDHPHPLILTYYSPYVGSAFTCDICRGMGSNHWLYRCAPCEFDAHLGCAKTQAQQQRSSHSHSRPQDHQRQPEPTMQGSTHASQPTFANPLLQSHSPYNDFGQFISSYSRMQQEMFRKTMEDISMHSRMQQEMLRNTMNQLSMNNNNNGYPFNMAPAWKMDPPIVPSGLKSSLSETILQGLGQMSMNNNNNNGGGDGQAQTQGFGNLGNPAESTVPDNLADMMNNYDWSGLANAGFDAAGGFM